MPRQPLYPHVPKSRKPRVGGGISMFTPTKGEERILILLEVSEQLAYAYLSAIHGYTKDAMTHVKIAQTELDKLGLDKEDLEPVTEPLGSISESMNRAQMGSYINDAQEELKRYGPGWTR